MEKWNKANITTLIQNNDKMVMRSVIQLYYKQTGDEKVAESTNHSNGAGFNSIDAKIMTGMAQFALSKGFLTQKQIAYLRPKLIKYSNQIANIANELNSIVAEKE